MPHGGKDLPSGLSQKHAKILQDMKDVVLLLSERKVDMNVMAIDQPGSSANGSTDTRLNEQNVNNRAQTTRFKDEIRMCLVLPLFYSMFPGPSIG